MYNPFNLSSALDLMYFLLLLLLNYYPTHLNLDQNGRGTYISFFRSLLPQLIYCLVILYRADGH